MPDKLKTAILGYGPQGQAWALNLRDSGRDIIVGLPSKLKSRTKAKKDGFRNISTTARAAKEADIIVFAFPDHLHGRVFEKEIQPNLKKNAALIFLAGYSIRFGAVTPSKDCDIILMAPLGPGNAVRDGYLKGESIGFFCAIHQNGSGRARKKLNSLIEDMHIDKKALIKTTFREEAVGDIFGEQAVLCGGLSQLIKSGYETLVESGLSPEKAYLETAFQLDLIVDLIKKHGIAGMFDRISVAARYGSYKSGPKIIDTSVKKKMKTVLREIESGQFARELNSLTPEKIKKLNQNIKKLSTASFEKVAKRYSGK